ncbi:MAG: hypothetical protein JNL05_05475 [Flavobacteriales bacterium]|nr:hypothetical protein [Flavobacteriales bacterium]
MRHSLLTLALMPFALSAQVTLFQTGFDTAPFAFDLNTTDAGSSASGSNTWLINNVYSGGTGDVLCSGIPLNYTIPSVAGQPVGINAPNGNYLHTASSEAVTDGILCCSFAAADGFCTNPGNHFARMNSDVSTVGLTNVTLGFWWLCNGGAQNYGEVYYSTNGGSSWNLITTPVTQYNGGSNWSQQSIALPAFDGQATLRFGFRFVNGTSLFGGSDPGFGVDDVVITGQQGVGNSISCQPTASQFCEGGLVQVQYSIQGVFTAGNVFTLQLSDALGSFAAPVDIGSVTTTSAGFITGSIPPGTPPGTGYRVRVVGSAPSTIGTASGFPLTITAAANAGSNSVATVCSNSAPFSLITLLGGSPDPGGTWTDPNGGPFSGTFTPGTSAPGCYVYTVGTGTNCAPASAVLCVQVVNAPDAGTSFSGTVCDDGSVIPMLPLLGGNPQPGGAWTAPGGAPHGPDFVVGVDPAGCYTYTVMGIPPCPSATAQVCITAVLPEADAGADSTVIICANSGPVDLFYELGGTPDTGGTWLTFGGAPFSGIFDPQVNTPGPYIYQVDGTSPCPDDQAIVTVVVDPCSGIDEAVAEDALRILSHDGNGTYRIAAPWTVENARVLDMLGRVAGLVVRNGSTLAVDLSQAPAGSYVVHVVGEGRGAMLRLVRP